MKLIHSSRRRALFGMRGAIPLALPRRLRLLRSASLLSGVFGALITFTAAAGCVEQAPELTAAQREQIRELVSNEAPTPQHPLDIHFDGRVKLIGYDVQPATLVPGQPFTITWYWQAQRRLDDGWQLFTHLADSRGQDRLNQDTVGVIRQVYQPGRWREGEYIRDVQQITLPADWGSDRVVFYLGVWQGDNRLEVTRGPEDGTNRARAATIEVSSAPGARVEPRPAQPPVPSLRVRRAGAMTIDGRLDEPEWNTAASTGPFVNTLNGAEAELPVTARALWDDQNLYVAFLVEDRFLRNTLTGRDAHLWEQDTVEIMLDPDGDGRNYYELQVSPTGEIFDTRYDSRRVPQPIGHADWNAQIQARATTRGTPNDEADDQGYLVEIAMAWSSFSTPPAEGAAAGEPLRAPEPGATWRMNLYVMDTMREGSRAAGWSAPMVGDFHMPARFGQITFEAPQAAAAPVERLQIAPEVQAEIGELMARRVEEQGLELSPEARRARTSARAFPR